MKIIVSVNRSDGNESVGDMWVETKSFQSTEPLENIYSWVIKKGGCLGHKISLTLDEAENIQEFIKMFQK